MIGETRQAALGKAEADIAVRLSRPTDEALVAHKIGMIDFALYGAPDHVSRGENRRSFIAYDFDQAELPQQKWLLDHVGEREIVLRVNDVESQRAAAAAGLGMAILPCYCVAGDHRLISIATPTRPSRELWLAFHADLQKTETIRVVIAFLADILGKPDLD